MVSINTRLFQRFLLTTIKDVIPKHRPPTDAFWTLQLRWPTDSIALFFVVVGFYRLAPRLNALWCIRHSMQITVNGVQQLQLFTMFALYKQCFMTAPLLNQSNEDILLKSYKLRIVKLFYNISKHTKSVKYKELGRNYKVLRTWMILEDSIWFFCCYVSIFSPAVCGACCVRHTQL